MNKGEKDIKTYPFLCLHKQGGGSLGYRRHMGFSIMVPK